MENAAEPTSLDVTEYACEVQVKESLEELINEMFKVLQPKWDRRHFNRALFSDIKELKELKREYGEYVKDNYAPEHAVQNSIHPVKDVLFVGKVQIVKIINKERWFEIQDETGSITVIDEQESGTMCDDYDSLHKNFREAEQKYKATKAPTPDDECSLNVAGARWLLARRRKDIATVPQREPEDFVGRTMMVLGKLSQKNRQRCVYMKKYVFMNKKQEECVKRNLEVSRWYEDQFKAKQKNAREKT